MKLDSKLKTSENGFDKLSKVLELQNKALHKLLKEISNRENVNYKKNKTSKKDQLISK